MNKRQNGALGFVCDPDFLLLGWTGISRLFSKNSGQFSSSSSAITNHGANLKICTQCDLARKLTAKKEEKLWKLGSTSSSKYGKIVLIWGNTTRVGCLLRSCRKWRPVSVQILRRICCISTLFSPQPIENCLSIDSGYFLLRVDCFSQHDRRFLHIQSQGRSADFSSLPGWYWVSCNGLINAVSYLHSYCSTI